MNSLALFYFVSLISQHPLFYPFTHLIHCYFFHMSCLLFIYFFTLSFLVLTHLFSSVLSLSLLVLCCFVLSFLCLACHILPHLVSSICSFSCLYSSPLFPAHLFLFYLGSTFSLCISLYDSFPFYFVSYLPVVISFLFCAQLVSSDLYSSLPLHGCLF